MQTLHTHLKRLTLKDVKESSTYRQLLESSEWNERTKGLTSKLLEMIYAHPSYDPQYTIEMKRIIVDNFMPKYCSGPAYPLRHSY